MALQMHEMRSAGPLDETAKGDDWPFHHVWKQSFSENLCFWDDRESDKRGPMQQDFIHNVSKQSLWMDSRRNPRCFTDGFPSSGLINERNSNMANSLSNADAIPASFVWACSRSKDLLRGSKLHEEIKKRCLIERNYSDALITMYAKCGELQKGQALLDLHSSRSFVPWNAMIAGYIQQRRWVTALKCFEQMQREHVVPTAITYGCILKACSAVGAVDKGKQIHKEILRQGLLEHNVVLGGALIDMYAKCGALSQALDVLRKLPTRDVISWSALISAYANSRQGEQALVCLEEMEAEGVSPNAVTYSCILKACASIGAIKKGKEIHDEILRLGLLENNVVLGGALVDMYAKCGALAQAQDVLRELRSRDAISWSALICGYAQNGQGHDALLCFDQMQAEGLAPDAVTYVCILKACASSGIIEKGKQIHDEILRQGLLEHNIALGGALVEMYAKCGALSRARDVLENLPSRNDVCWSALIVGYALKGNSMEAFECYERMKDEGIAPDTITFLCLLNVCNHLGLVAKAQKLFDSMEATHGLTPSLQCFNCMIDLLGRAGHLAKAADLIRNMPFPCDISTWHTVLAACCKWVNVTMGTWAFEQVLEIDRFDVVAYVLMADIYMAAGMQEKASYVETLRRRHKAWKVPGCSLWPS